MIDPADLARVVERLSGPPRLAVITGAGISAASGVPTFRGADGLWRSHRAESLATPEAFAADPALVWEWYAWRREVVAGCAPNRGHAVLADWSRRFRRFTLVTQNVDGLHERAGTRGVLRFHGSLWELRCWRRCPGSPPSWRETRVPLPELPPRCPHCGGLARPAVTWFGEAIDPTVLEAATAAMDCDLCLLVGTSSVVFPAAGLVDVARARGAFTVEVNPEATAASVRVDLALAGPAEEVLDQLDRALPANG